MANGAQNEFEPILTFDNTDACELRSGQSAEIELQGTLLAGKAVTRLLLTPTPRVVIEATFPLNSGTAPFTFSSDTPIARFSVDGNDVDGIASSITPDLMSGVLAVTWTPKDHVQATGDKETRVSGVTFHLFNLPYMLGGRRSMASTPTSRVAIEHLDLKHGDYSIEIRSLINADATIKMLKARGGFGMTHIGRIMRVDGQEFSGEVAESLINALRWFLSFGIGRWCEPVCPYACDKADNRIWEIWSSPSSHTGTRFSWFDHRNMSQLSDFFPKFMDLWSSPDWQEPLRECIYWYVAANDSSRGIDAGLILAQTGLERLAFEYAVNEKRLVSAQGFKDLRASDKLRLLLSSLNIPVDIPTETPALQLEAKAENWADAPHALTESRNALVHPGRKQKRMTGDPLLEAWQLGMWYLEMSILAVCGYEGTYGSRLIERSIGQVDRVPWA